MKLKKLISVTLLAALAINLASFNSTNSATAATDDIKAFAAGTWHTALIKSDNTLWVYGDNKSGQLGTGDTTSSADPVKVMDGVKDVAVGRSTTIALKTDGSVWVWGLNIDEQLGTKAKPKATGGIAKDDDSLIIDTPTQLMSGVKDVVAGDGYMMALKTDGSLYVWGSNSYYQLGIDEASAIATRVPSNRGVVPNYRPTKILTGVAFISAGSHHAAAVKTDGSLYMWGYNMPHAQCGYVTTGGYVPKPTKIMDSGVKAVSCGKITTAVLKTDGSLWMMGDNECGQLGIGYAEVLGKPITRQQVPVKVLSGVKAVSALGWCTLALKTDGSLWTWGMDGFVKGVTLEPTKRTTGITALASGARIAIKSDGSLYDWH